MYQDFDLAKAPFTDFSVPCAVAIAYVALVLIQAAVDPPGVGSVRSLRAAHNLILSVGSAAMMCGALYEMYRRSQTDGLTWLLCEDSDITATGPLYFWSYMYYMSKYYELLDTVLQWLRGKKSPNYVLHVYHHAVIIVLSWSWPTYTMSLQFIALVFNTLVHVVMYYYYFVCTIGKPPKWKSYVTVLQIVQFVTSIFGLCGYLYFVVVERRDCAGGIGIYATMLFNVTLLYSFVQILLKSLQRSSPKPKTL